MDWDQAPCLDCAAAVPRDAQRCPACEYDLRYHDRRRRWFGGLGTLLTLTVALAPLGLPLLYLALGHRRAAEGTVTRRSDAPLGADLRTVVGGFLSLDRPATDGGRSGVGRRRGDPNVTDARQG